ncbi:hypothetical protein EC973_003779, partial [Apophysomyces ossiformis]
MKQQANAPSSGENGDGLRDLPTPNVRPVGSKLATLVPSANATMPLTSRPMGRDRSLPRDDVYIPAPSSRPPSIRSASSFGRQINHRFIYGQHTRRHSNYSSFSTMSETSLPWTTRDIGFNAISGVLNDPAKRTQAASKPGKADIPPVSHAYIPRIKPSDFESYLEHIGPAFERYQYNKLNEDDNLMSPSHSPYGSLHNLHEAVDESSLPAHQRRSSRNPYSLPQNVLSSESLTLDVDDRPSPPPRELPMLENVPPIFFEPEFYLEDPRTFDAVCEGADIIGNSGPNPPISTNSILQEKLSYYLDTVEVHLIREIENRSSSFFEALSNLQALHQQTVDCVSQIHSIRQKMKHIQDTECKDGLNVIRLQVRRRNLENLYDTIKTIHDIRSVQSTIQVLLGQGDYFAALDLIDETRLALEGSNDSVDFKAIRALVNFSSQLEETQKTVGIMMQHDFLSILLSDLSYKMETIDMELAEKRLVGESRDESIDREWTVDLDEEKELLEKLMPSAMGLLRTGMIMTTLQGYKERLLVEVKDLVRKQYPTAQDADVGQNQLAKLLKSMPFNSFFRMLLNLFAVLTEMIQRAAVYERVISRLMDDCADRLSKDGLQESLQELRATIRKESSDIVFAAADLAHVRCGKMISYRSDQNAVLNPTDFYRLSNVMQMFIQQCEVYCGRTCFGLRGTVLSQQKSFVNHFHMERIKQEAQLIENEQWVSSEVPSDFQRIVDRICDGGISSFAEMHSEEKKEEERTKSLFVNGSSYFVVGCTLLIIKMFEEYLRCALNLEGMTTDIMQKLVELLKLFNSRVCQVILGAGAMRSAGLKNISAKHLALALQSLGVMVELIPSLKECLRRRMPAKHVVLLVEFDRIVNDYKDHQSEIHAKLVGIMNERLSVHIAAMKEVVWEEEDDPNKSANGYMETLVRETMTLHKVLNRYLKQRDLQTIMSQVFQSFTTQLSQEFNGLSIGSDRGKARVVKDAQFFTRRLSSLQGIDAPSTIVIDTANAISPRSP